MNYQTFQDNIGEVQKDENGKITGVTPTGKDYEIEFEDIMDGDETSSSGNGSSSLSDVKQLKGDASYEVDVPEGAKVLIMNSDKNNTYVVMDGVKIYAEYFYNSGDRWAYSYWQPILIPSSIRKIEIVAMEGSVINYSFF